MTGIIIIIAAIILDFVTAPLQARSQRLFPKIQPATAGATTKGVLKAKGVTYLCVVPFLLVLVFDNKLIDSDSGFFIFALVLICTYGFATYFCLKKFGAE